MDAVINCNTTQIRKGGTPPHLNLTHIEHKDLLLTIQNNSSTVYNDTCLTIGV